MSTFGVWICTMVFSYINVLLVVFKVARRISRLVVSGLCLSVGYFALATAMPPLCKVCVVYGETRSRDGF